MSELNTEKTTGVLSEQLREVLRKKEEICAALEKLETAEAIDYPSEISRLGDEYAAAGTVPPEFAELLDKRFAEAVRTARAGENAYREREQQLAKLSADADALIAAGDLATLDEVAKLEQRVSALAPSSELLARIAPLKERLAAEDAALKATEAAAVKLAEELENLCENEEITPLKERKPGIEAEFAMLANIPRKAAQRYNDAHRKASMKLAQHYETLDLARWESYTRKLDICAALEKLLEEGDGEMAAASKKLNELREQWKNLGSVPKEKSEEINPRYLELTRKLQRRIDEFFARKRQEQRIAASEKEQLCAEAEALADSTDWKNTAEKMKELQAKWKMLPRAGTREGELFKRFRAGQDKFFDARKSAFDERDKRFHASEEAKTALIAEAENLTDFQRAKQLREEFRNAGFSGRHDHELYQRFNAAMDRFFDARKAENTSREEKARALCEEIGSLTAEPLTAANRIREIREELRGLACRETRRTEEELLRKFDAALQEARQAERRVREQNSDAAAMTLAQAYGAWKNGEAPTIPSPDDLAGFGKLQTEAKLLTDAAGGDEKAAVKLEKQIAAARIERERLCAAMEKLGGKKSGEKSGEVDLAAELRSAMLGDFGKGGAADDAPGAADPHRLASEFAAAGIVPPDELAEFQRRFAAAKAIVLPGAE